MSEKRQFQMHAKLLYDVIRRQAGTLSKAILEGIMNSVDAGATECRITIAPKRVTVSDDGKGFKNRAEIEKFFEVFGQPHDESEGKTYGTFRMGRGQMFAFGVNAWRTGKFSMSIDIQNEGLDYHLHDEAKNHKGCRIEIELYSQLLPSDMDSCIRDLEDWVKWCPIPVYLNDELISNDPAEAKWDFITDEAYVKLKATGGLAVYNLGVHVLTFQGYKYGTGGEVVSRKQVKVNFARNDIQSDCEVWNVVKKLVDQKASEKSEKKKALNDNERQRLVDRILTGELDFEEGRKMRLITAATGRQYDLDVFFNSHEWPQITSAPKGNRKADKLMKSKIAFVVADETLDRFRVKRLAALIDKLKPLETVSWRDWSKVTNRLVSFHDLTQGMSDKYEVFLDEDLNPTEKLWHVLMVHGMSRLRCSDKHAGYRRLQIGRSETAEGWTDGASYICVARRFLGRQQFDMGSFIRVGNLLLHEMCHHSPDLEDHDHDQAFFEEYHDNSDSVAEFTAACFAHLPKAVAQLNRKLTKKMLKDQDTVVKAEAAVAEFPHVQRRKP